MDHNGSFARVSVRTVRNRITRTIIGVAALVIVVLGVPFAIVLQRFYESRATAELQRTAAEAIAELALPLNPEEIADAAREPDAPADFSVYDAAGDRLFGVGPYGPTDPRGTSSSSSHRSPTGRPRPSSARSGSHVR